MKSELKERSESGYGVFGIFDHPIPVLDDHVVVQIDPSLEQCQVSDIDMSFTNHVDTGRDRKRHPLRDIHHLRVETNFQARITRLTSIRGYPHNERQTGMLWGQVRHFK